jgi:small nuclear ribonucleoprotein (snRNP)-like protein
MSISGGGNSGGGSAAATTTSNDSFTQSLLPLYNSNNIIGQFITIQNPFNEMIEGQVYAYDPSMNMLVLYESGDQHESSKRKTFRIVHTKQCKCISVAKRKQSAVPFSNTSQPLPGVNLDKLKERENSAVAERKQKLGFNVSHDAQNIFDALSKTLPCRWNQNEIIVMEMIKIVPPYQLENVSGGDNHSRERVKKVVCIHTSIVCQCTIC